MTKKEIIYAVFEKLNIQSDDTNLSEELVSYLLDTKRAMLLKQQYAKNGWHMPIEIKQELCLSLKLIDAVGGYSCAGKMLATDGALPRSIKIKGKEGPLTVRKADGRKIALNIVPIERIPFLFENRMTAHLTYCAVDFNRRLYIISKDDKHKFLKSIKVTDIFEEPDKALLLTCDYDSSKDEWDYDYPVEAAMADTIIDLVVKELTRTLGLPADNINDAADERRQ